MHKYMELLQDLGSLNFKCGRFRENITMERVRHDRHNDVISLSDEIGPFEPYVDTELNERIGFSDTLDDVNMHRARHASVEFSGKDVEHFESESNETPLVPHAYARVGELLPGTYSRATSSTILQSESAPRLTKLSWRAPPPQTKSSKHTACFTKYRPYG
jgi:hypothetical protein